MDVAVMRRVLVAGGVVVALMAPPSPARAASARHLNIHAVGVIYNGGGGPFGGFEQAAGTAKGMTGKSSYDESSIYTCDVLTAACTHSFEATITTRHGSLYVGGGPLDGPNEAAYDGPFVIVGGTGRFAGATGSGLAVVVEHPAGSQTMTLIGSVSLSR